MAETVVSTLTDEGGSSEMSGFLLFKGSSWGGPWLALKYSYLEGKLFAIAGRKSSRTN